MSALASEGVHAELPAVHPELPAGTAPAGSAPAEVPPPAGAATAVARWELAIEHALFTRLYFSRTPWEEELFDRYRLLAWPLRPPPIARPPYEPLEDTESDDDDDDQPPPLLDESDLWDLSRPVLRRFARRAEGA